MSCCDAVDLEKFIPCDELAVALALDPRVATAEEEVTCSVDISHSVTRGQMIVHRSPRDTNSSGVFVVTALDTELCAQLLTAGLSD